MSSKIRIPMLMIVLCLISCSVGCSNTTGTKRTAFEYMDIAREAGSLSPTSIPDHPANHPFYKYGAEGWELVAVSGPYESIPSPSGDSSKRLFIFHFKRLVFIER